MVNDIAHNYISIRVFAAPFALANFAFMGWLIAVEKSFTVMLIQSSVTLMNIILDLFFVIY
ncbi:MAG: MATE family efflux transporter, partial [Pelagibacteraceae bacterium]|nr:MATE family efflux transporter [Pelagibacteraceae bacterium]